VVNSLVCFYCVSSLYITNYVSQSCDTPCTRKIDSRSSTFDITSSHGLPHCSITSHHRKAEPMRSLMLQTSCRRYGGYIRSHYVAQFIFSSKVLIRTLTGGLHYLSPPAAYLLLLQNRSKAARFQRRRKAEASIHWHQASLATTALLYLVRLASRRSHRQDLSLMGVNDQIC